MVPFLDLKEKENNMRDLHNKIKVGVALNISAISTNTTTAGAIIDKRGYRSVEFIIMSGTLTDGTYTPLIEESDNADLSSSNAVADADLLGTEAAAALIATEDNTTKKVGYIGGKRYVRMSVVSTGVTTGGTVLGVALRANAADLPVV